MLTISELENRLAHHEARTVQGSGRLRNAAVAAVCAETSGDLELLFISRAEDPRDPWSGHMAFPGGRVDSTDEGPLEAAIRETREEVGLDLAADGQLIGHLSDVPAVARGRRLPMVIFPFVFRLRGAPPPLSINHEVEEALWVPLDFLAERRNRSSLRWKRGGIAVPLPCYRYQERVIWGLTLKMVDELLRVIEGE